MVQEFQDRLRAKINNYIFENGYAPDVATLVSLTSTCEQEVRTGLDDLATNHAIVLHPGTHDIWVAHPFALFPTLFWVESGDQKWWGNCAWCSLGIASITEGRNAVIYTRIAGEEKNVIIEITEGRLQQPDLLVHFVVPGKHLWDNVIYTCANMLVFESESQIDKWCEQHRVSHGDVATLSTVWELSKLWYGNYLSEDWRRKTAQEAREILDAVGLNSPFWQF